LTIVISLPYPWLDDTNICAHNLGDAPM